MKKPFVLSSFRLFGILDGVSLLILLCIAMPLKYMADLPMAVTIVGSIHGFIFCVYIVTIIFAQLFLKWRVYWSILALVAAVVPVGNFVLDVYIHRNRQKFLQSNNKIQQNL